MVVALCCLVVATAGYLVRRSMTASQIEVTDQLETPMVEVGSAQTEELPDTVIDETVPDEPDYKPTNVSLIAVGDNLIHGTLRKDAANGDGTYDFTPFYTDIKPCVEAADIAVINQESPLGTGTPSAHPTFNTPQSCGTALIDAGFDVVSHANNHAMDSGVMPLVCDFRSGWCRYHVIPMDDYTDDLANTHCLAGRTDMRVSTVRSIARQRFGEFLMHKTILITYAEK